MYMYWQYAGKWTRVFILSFLQCNVINASTTYTKYIYLNLNKELSCT